MITIHTHNLDMIEGTVDELIRYLQQYPVLLAFRSKPILVAHVTSTVALRNTSSSR